jgi:serine carboxypeptidase-like clade 1
LLRRLPVMRPCAAVGLSYSDNHADYSTNDTATAADSHRFLRQLFTLYPHFLHNDFYIAGEAG